MVVKNGCIICFVRSILRRIQICIAVMLASWSLSLDKLEWNCAISMVYGFNLLQFSSVTPSIEMDLQSVKYCEWTFSLSTWHISKYLCVHFQSNLLCQLTNMLCCLPSKWFVQGCKHGTNVKPIFKFLECNILNENPKFCIISVQVFCVL